MNEGRLGLIQKCSTGSGLLIFLHMADKRYEQGRQKALLEAMLDRGAQVRQAILKDVGIRKMIFLIAAADFKFASYLSRLTEIFLYDSDQEQKIYFTSAFNNGSGSYRNNDPREIINTWLDLDYGVFITFREENAKCIIDYLQLIKKPEEQLNR